MSGGASGEVWTFDTETKKFGAHKFTVPPSYPEDSVTFWSKLFGEDLPPVRATSYDIKVNSKGKYYLTIYSMGTLIRPTRQQGNPRRIIQNWSPQHARTGHRSAG